MGIIGPTAPSGPAGGSLSGTYPNPGIANAILTGSNPTTAVPPVAGAAEGELKYQIGLTIARSIWVVWTAKAEVKIPKVKTFMATEFVAVLCALKTTNKLPSGGTSVTIAKWKVENNSEIEIELAAAPVAKDEIWFLIVG